MSDRLLSRQALIFAAMWLFVIFVSVFDGYLVLRFRHEMHRTELNPLGRFLIQINGGQVWLMLAAKFAGTVAAASVVLVVYGRWPRAGLAIAGAVAGFQLCLLLFLLLR